MARQPARSVPSVCDMWNSHVLHVLRQFFKTVLTQLKTVYDSLLSWKLVLPWA